MKNAKRLLALLLALLLVASLTACKAREPAEEPEEEEVSEPEPEPEPEPEEEIITVASVIPEHIEDIYEAKEINEDAVGWLTIDVLDLSEIVVMDDSSNSYYERRDLEEQYYFPGILFLDRRTELGDGTAKELGMNTTIYGHALTDGEYFTQYEYWDKFGPLNELRKEEVAAGMPYLFFSTEADNLAFEVFAVCDINISVPYNRNDITREEMLELVREEILPRSFYNYDVEIADDDKFMILSTCIYQLDGVYLGYPNNYRLIVAARLCDPEEPLKEEAVFEVNEDPMAP